MAGSTIHHLHWGRRGWEDRKRIEGQARGVEDAGVVENERNPSLSRGWIGLSAGRFRSYCDDSVWVFN